MVTLNSLGIVGICFAILMLAREINKVFSHISKACNELDERLEAVEQKNK